MADVFSSMDPDPPGQVTVAIILTCLLFLIPVALYLYISLVPSSTEKLFLALGDLNDDDNEGREQEPKAGNTSIHDNATSPTSPITPSSISESKALIHSNNNQMFEQPSITNCPKAYVSFRNLRLYIIEKVKPIKRQPSTTAISTPKPKWYKFKSNKVGVTKNDEVEDIVAAAAKTLALKSAKLIDEDPQRAPTPINKDIPDPLSLSLSMSPALPADDKPIEKKPRKPRPKFVRRQVLKDISGFAEPGTLTAIMGPSGCGKTSLLDVLASRHPSDQISGSIRINAKSRSQRYMKRISAYVLQNDVLFSHLTVREALLYTVDLRVDKTVSSEEKWRRVDQVIADLELTHVANTKVGGDDVRGGGLSGGQKRRLSIAMELVTFPSVLFLDEPTTGLDAYSSLRLVMTLRKLADKNRTIICTINQPRSDIFELFDYLLLLKNGAMAYFGPINSIRTYFAEQNMPIPPDANVADFVVDLTYDKSDDHMERLLNYETNSTGGDMTPNPFDRPATAATVNSVAGTVPPSPTSSSPVPGQQPQQQPFSYREEWEHDSLILLYRESSLKKAMDEKIKKVSLIDAEELFMTEDGKDKLRFVRYPTSLIRQVHTLIRRSMTNSNRQQASSLSSWILASGNFLFYGLLYLGLMTSDKYVPTDLTFVQSQKAFIFQVISGVCLLELEVLARAFLEKNIFFREHASGAYSTPSYHLSWFLRLNFQGFVRGIIYTPLCYLMSSLTITADRYFYFSLIVALMSTTGSSIAFLLISAIPALEGAASAYSAIIGTMATFCGFFFLPKLIPPWFIYSYYMSYYKYALEGLYWNEFWGREVVWKNETLVSNTYSGVSPIIASLTNTTETATVERREVLDILQVDTTLNRWTNLIVLLFFPLIFHFFAYLASALHVGAKKRNSKIRNLAKFLKSLIKRKSNNRKAFPVSDTPIAIHPQQSKLSSLITRLRTTIIPNRTSTNPSSSGYIPSQSPSQEHVNHDHDHEIDHDHDHEPHNTPHRHRHHHSRQASEISNMRALTGRVYSSAALNLMGGVKALQ